MADNPATDNYHSQVSAGSGTTRLGDMFHGNSDFLQISPDFIENSDYKVHFSVPAQNTPQAWEALNEIIDNNPDYNAVRKVAKPQLSMKMDTDNYLQKGKQLTYYVPDDMDRSTLARFVAEVENKFEDLGFNKGPQVNYDKQIGSFASYRNETASNDVFNKIGFTESDIPKNRYLSARQIDDFLAENPDFKGQSHNLSGKPDPFEGIESDIHTNKQKLKSPNASPIHDTAKQQTNPIVNEFDRNQPINTQQVDLDVGEAPKAETKFDPDKRQTIKVEPTAAKFDPDVTQKMDLAKARKKYAADVTPHTDAKKVDLDIGDNLGSKPDMRLQSGPTKVDFDVGEAPKAETKAKPDADSQRLAERREAVKRNLAGAKQKIEGQKPAAPAKPVDASDQRIKTTTSALAAKADKGAGRAEMAIQVATGDYAGAAMTAASDQTVQKAAAKVVEAVAEKPGFWASAAKYAGKAAKVARALPVVGGVVVAAAAATEVYGQLKEGNYKAAATTAAARTAEAAATTVGGYVAGQAVYTGAQKAASAAGVEIAKSDAEQLYDAAKEKLAEVEADKKAAPARGRSYSEPKREEPTQTASATTHQYKARGASSPSSGFNSMAAKPADIQQPKQPEVAVAKIERSNRQQISPGMMG